MARQYEIVYIFDSSLEEAQVNECLERLHQLLRSTDYPQPVTSVNHWGKRTLAYPIHNKEVGYYVVTQFETDAAVLPEFERALKLDDSVLRYLLVLNEGVTPAVPVGDDVGAVSLESEEGEE
jgi:small subunit ribosomal protein S6